MAFYFREFMKCLWTLKALIGTAYILNPFVFLGEQKTWCVEVNVAEIPLKSQLVFFESV